MKKDKVNSMKKYGKTLIKIKSTETNLSLLARLQHLPVSVMLRPKHKEIYIHYIN